MTLEQAMAMLERARESRLNAYFVVSLLTGMHQIRPVVLHGAEAMDRIFPAAQKP